jgi:hypothetical protein
MKHKGLISKEDCTTEKDARRRLRSRRSPAPQDLREARLDPRCTTYAQIPPGCTPQLQWGPVVDTKFDSSNHGLC